jgi:hypothetical protein
MESTNLGPAPCCSGESGIMKGDRFSIGQCAFVHVHCTCGIWGLDHHCVLQLLENTILLQDIRFRSPWAILGVSVSTIPHYPRLYTGYNVHLALTPHRLSGWDQVRSHECLARAYEAVSSIASTMGRSPQPGCTLLDGYNHRASLPL